MCVCGGGGGVEVKILNFTLGWGKTLFFCCFFFLMGVWWGGGGIGHLQVFIEDHFQN